MAQNDRKKEIHLFINRAIELAGQNIESGNGGPFGAVVVKNGMILSEAGNNVLKDNDPTAHAEIVAIREACKKTGSYFLDDCEIFCSCEPCPMCLGAIYWSHIKSVYYCADRKNAADAGFDDSFIYNEIQQPDDKRKTSFIRIINNDCEIPFKKWKNMINKKTY